ncbi:MAG: SRPBCC family protein [Polyangiales bacterium]|nr:SRPBCC family protein [Myxococcales bacterium]MCB9660251.1 SRPBCC family protein [Sandaracinaceae bacterium]
MQRKVDLHFDFPFPVARVFADVSDHENLGRILGAPMRHLKDGHGEGGKSGLGSVRGVGPALLGLEETIVTFEKDRLIEYKVTQGPGVKNHLGRLTFSETQSGSHLHYVITFEPTIPGTGRLLQSVLSTSIGKGLRKYAER